MADVTTGTSGVGKEPGECGVAGTKEKELKRKQIYIVCYLGTQEKQP